MDREEKLPFVMLTIGSICFCWCWLPGLNRVLHQYRSLLRRDDKM